MTLQFDQIIQKGLDLYCDYSRYISSRGTTQYQCYKRLASALGETRFAGPFHKAIQESGIEHIAQAQNIRQALKKARRRFISEFTQQVNQVLQTNHPRPRNLDVLANHVNGSKWHLYAEGDNSIILRSNDESHVLRRALNSFDEMSEPHRLYDIFSRVYPQYRVEIRGPWIKLPFFGSVTPSDATVAEEVIRIYQDTRIIIADAWIDGNFRELNGQAVCVDFEYGVWRGDVASEAYVEHVLMGTHRYETMCKNTNSQTVAAVCTLLYLEKYLEPDEIKSEYITPRVIRALHAYRRKNRPISAALLERLALSSEPLFELLLEEALSQQLHAAIIADDINKVRQLINRGADVNAPLSPYGESDFTGTPIALCLKKSKDKISILLFSAGAKLPKAENGQNHYIHVAAKYGFFDDVKKLYEADHATLDVEDSMKQTPLLWAASRGRKDVVDYLVRKGAKLNTQTNLANNPTHEMNGATVLDWAIKYGDASIIRFLEKAGARRKCDLSKPTRRGRSERYFKQHSLFPSNHAISDDEVSINMTFSTYAETEEAVTKAAHVYEVYRENLGARTQHWYELKQKREHYCKSSAKFDEWLRQDIHQTALTPECQEKRMSHYFMSEFDDLPFHIRVGWVAFALDIASGKTPDVAWNRSITEGWSENMKAHCQPRNRYSALFQPERAAVDAASNSLPLLGLTNS